MAASNHEHHDDHLLSDEALLAENAKLKREVINAINKIAYAPLAPRAPSPTPTEGQPATDRGLSPEATQELHHKLDFLQHSIDEYKSSASSTLAHHGPSQEHMKKFANPKQLAGVNSATGPASSGVIHQSGGVQINEAANVNRGSNVRGSTAITTRPRSKAVQVAPTGLSVFASTSNNNHQSGGIQGVQGGGEPRRGMDVAPPKYSEKHESKPTSKMTAEEQKEFLRKFKEKGAKMVAEGGGGFSLANLIPEQSFSAFKDETTATLNELELAIKEHYDAFGQYHVHLKAMGKEMYEQHQEIQTLKLGMCEMQKKQDHLKRAHHAFVVVVAILFFAGGLLVISRIGDLEMAYRYLFNLTQYMRIYGNKAPVYGYNGPPE